MTEQTYKWTDNPTESGVAICDTDVLNDCLMHLKYDKKGGDGFSLFDTKVCDHVLVGDEAIGWALQGSLVTMVYPDAVNRIKELYAGGDETTYREIACKRSSDGRFVADISQKPAIDELYLSTGVADFYILDSVNQLFYLPRNDWFMQGTSDPSKVNDFVEAGLPNITGDFTYGENNCGIFRSDGSRGTGALKNGDKTTQSFTGTNIGGYSLSFDASLSNPIYGNSEIVQPPSSLKLVYYKVGNTVVNESLIDVGEVLSQLQLKADVDLSNATPSQAFKNISTDWSVPDYVNKITVHPSGYDTRVNGLFKVSNKYISPADGYVRLGISGSANFYFNDIPFQSYSNNYQTIVWQEFRVNAGDTIYGGDVLTWYGMYFFPLKGAN